MAWHNGWVGNDVGTDPGNYWLLGTDTVQLYRANSTVVKSGTGNNFQSGTGNDGSGTSKWTINAGLLAANEQSDWACAAMLHYNRELPLAEIKQVSTCVESSQPRGLQSARS